MPLIFLQNIERLLEKGKNSMVVRIHAFTKEGWNVLHSIFDSWNEAIAITKGEKEALTDWIKEAFEKRIPLVFIGAIGIVVRLISPYIKDKLWDSSVTVIEEKGSYVIPILSGHIGGGNDLARSIAKRIQAIPVITTATDVQNTFAVDSFAKKNRLHIVNREGIRLVSKKVLEEGRISIFADLKWNCQELEKWESCVNLVSNQEVADVVISEKEILNKKALLYLQPKRIVLGIGCKKGKKMEEIKKSILCILKEKKLEKIVGNELCMVHGIASIDLKKRELGLLEFAAYYHLPFKTYSVKELGELQGQFSVSTFVEQTTGVSNVCERAAVKYAGEKMQMILPKTSLDGVTLSVVMIVK